MIYQSFISHSSFSRYNNSLSARFFITLYANCNFSSIIVLLKCVWQNTTTLNSVTNMASSDRRLGRESDSTPSSHEEKMSGNVFKNDGSFLEMFKKAQQSGAPMPGTSAPSQVTSSAAVSSQAVSETDSEHVSKKSSKDVPKPKYGFVGKRRGGKILPTGKVKKAKQDEDEDTGKKDAWSQHMSEVKKYKDQSCQEEGKTRPLVK